VSRRDLPGKINDDFRNWFGLGLTVGMPSVLPLQIAVEIKSTTVE